MDELEDIKAELNRLEDLVGTAKFKLCNVVGLLELIYLGIRQLSGSEDSYELSAISVLQDYLKTIEKTDIQRLYEKITSLKERV